MRLRICQWLALSLLSLWVCGCGSGDDDFLLGGSDGVLPVAVNDAFPALGNTPLTVTVNQGVLVNDTGGGIVTNFNQTSANGGTIAMSFDGSFQYTPAFGFLGNDTFAYTVSNFAGSSNATVTISITTRALYVNNTAPAGGNGAFATPFNTLAAAAAASVANDTIFIFRGDGTSNNMTGTITLKNGQKLIGEAVGLDLSGVNPQTVVSPGLRPAITGPVVLADDNVVRGLALDGSATQSIRGTTINNASLTHNEFRNYGGPAVQLQDSTGTLTMSNNTVEPVANQDGIVLTANNANSTVVISNNAFPDDAAIAPNDCVDIDTTGTSQTNLTFSNNTVTSPDGTAGWSDGITVVFNGGSGTFTASGNQIAGVRSDGIQFHSEGNAQVSVNWSGNTLSDLGDNPFELVCEDTSTMTGSLTGNTVTDPNDRLDNGLDLISADTGNANLTVSQNNFTGAEDGYQVISVDNSQCQVSFTANSSTSPEEDGFFIDSRDSSSLTAILSQNTVTGAGQEAYQGVGQDMSTFKAALRQNTFPGQTSDDIVALSADTAMVCYDITGNSCDQLVLAHNGGTLDVERFDALRGGPLETVNTITAGVAQVIGTPTAQNAGFCGL